MSWKSCKCSYCGINKGLYLLEKCVPVARVYFLVLFSVEELCFYKNYSSHVMRWSHRVYYMNPGEPQNNVLANTHCRLLSMNVSEWEKFSCGGCKLYKLFHCPHKLVLQQFEIYQSSSGAPVQLPSDFIKAHRQRNWLLSNLSAGGVWPLFYPTLLKAKPSLSTI